VEGARELLSSSPDLFEEDRSKDWSKVPSFPVPKDKNPPKYSSTSPPWVDPATFFDQLPAVMKQIPPMPGEEALYNWIGSVLDAAAKDPEVMATLRETAFAADPELIAMIAIAIEHFQE